MHEKELIDSVNKLEDKVVAYRRDFHKYAESGWTEFRTTSIIAETLQKLGFEVRLGRDIIDPDSAMGRPHSDIIKKHMERAVQQGGNREIIDKTEGYTGVVGILDTGVKGPTTAFRFDIDANDAFEAEDDTHRPFREGFSSVNPGAMHACGHDGHTAVGLALAELIVNHRDTLKGKIKLIFQPAEEGVRGAKAMVKRGVLDDVDYFLSGHIGFGLETNTICPAVSGFLSTTKIDVDYRGKGAHAGANPEKGNNALLAAACAVMNIHSIPPHSGGITRVNVGVLNSGVGRNVVPPNAFMKIETRGENSELNSYVYDKTVKILKNAADMYGVDCRIEKVGESITVKCDDELAEIVRSEVLKLPFLKIIEDRSLGGSEDAAFMIERVHQRNGRGCYILFGSAVAAGHHNEKFDFDEKVLVNALLVYTKLLMRLNNRNGD